uniref:F-box domain-containing protein n=1 Tax=Panagrellus redivivus TaxID=6233 RepID=A0A7E4W9V9_PANRE
MPNPILAIRRKASSFRENRVKPLFVARPRIMPEAKTTDSTAQKPKGKCGLVDPEYSLENFLNRLRSTPSVFASLRKPTVKRARLETCIDALPDTCLEAILGNLDQKDFLSARLVCKKLNTVVQKSTLGRKSVSRLQLNEDSQGQLYRFTPLQAPHFDRYALPPMGVIAPMRHLKARMITFDNITINMGMVEVFEQAVDYTLDEVVFDFCHFNLSDFEIGHLLRSWRPRSVSFINCDWRDSDSSQTVAISDSLFALNTQLQSFVFSNIGCKKLLVSDRTLQRFDQLLHLPHSFQLAGCTSNITLSGISGAINAYLESCPRPNVSYHIPASILPPYLWEFGIIENANLQEALQHFAPLLKHGYVAQSSSSNLELRFTSAQRHLAPLYVTIGFRVTLPMAFVSPSVDGDDIPWDDSDGENDTESD